MGNFSLSFSGKSILYNNHQNRSITSLIKTSGKLNNQYLHLTTGAYILRNSYLQTWDWIETQMAELISMNTGQPLEERKSSYYPWLVWSLGALFFFVEYFARVAPNVMAPDLMRAFHVNALALGVLSASFYFAYVGMQLPVGSLMDRYGPRRLLALTAMVCALGCYLFARADSVEMAAFGRFMLGFGSAFAFVGALTLAAAWFPAHKIGLLAGLTQALGMLGAAVGEAPMESLVQQIGWRVTSAAIALVFVAMGMLIALLVRDKPSDRSGQPAISEPHADMIAGFKRVLSTPSSWSNALFAGLLYTPTAVLGELWGASALVHTHGLTMSAAASVIGFVFIGWAIGGPLIGWISDKLRRRRFVMFCSAVGSLLFLLPLLYAKQLSVVSLSIFMFFYGLCNTGVVLTYALATEIHPRAYVGTSLAFANMVSILIGALFHPLIGWLLDFHSQGAMERGVAVYTASDFSWAMMSLPIVLCLAVVCSFFVPETNCRPLVGDD